MRSAPASISNTAASACAESIAKWSGVLPTGELFDDSITYRTPVNHQCDPLYSIVSLARPREGLTRLI